MISSVESEQTSQESLDNEYQQIDETEEPINEVYSKMFQLRNVLGEDMFSCDAKWTLFVAAALSYRYDSYLQPVPPQFSLEHYGCDIDGLMAVIRETPKLDIVLRYLNDVNVHEIKMEVLDLLHWVLVLRSEPMIRSVHRDDFELLMFGIDPNTQSDQIPTHVFEVTHSVHSSAEAMYQEEANANSKKLAFYGDKLDCIYYLLGHGFQHYRCSGNDFCAKRLTLTTDIQRAMRKSPVCPAWGGSQCGSMMGCVAVCEFINDTAHAQTSQQIGDGDGRCRGITIENSDFVRLRYLLFYGNYFVEEVEEAEKPTTIMEWIYDHRFAIYLSTYLFALSSMAISNPDYLIKIKDFLEAQTDVVINLYRRLCGLDN